MPDDQVTKKRRPARAVGQMPGVPSEVLDQLMSGYQKPEDLTAPDGLLNQLKKAIAGSKRRRRVAFPAPPAARAPRAPAGPPGRCGGS